MNTVTQKILNDFCKTQPALQLPGKQASVAGIQLGDLIAENAPLAPAEAVDIIDTLNPVGTAVDPTAALASDVDARITTLQEKIDELIVKLFTAGYIL